MTLMTDGLMLSSLLAVQKSVTLPVVLAKRYVLKHISPVLTSIKVATKARSIVENPILFIFTYDSRSDSHSRSCFR